MNKTIYGLVSDRYHIIQYGIASWKRRAVFYRDNANAQIYNNLGFNILKNFNGRSKSTSTA